MEEAQASSVSAPSVILHMPAETFSPALIFSSSSAVSRYLAQLRAPDPETGEKEPIQAPPTWKITHNVARVSFDIISLFI